MSSPPLTFLSQGTHARGGRHDIPASSMRRDRSWLVTRQSILPKFLQSCRIESWNGHVDNSFHTYGVESRDFNHHSSMVTPCRLFESRPPWTAEELATAIAQSAPSLVDISHFMAEVLLGQKDELPIQIDARSLICTFRINSGG